jgi:Mn2+/Fe2+ NRAMP family transporter
MSDTPRSDASRFRLAMLVGPGLMVAATGVGAGDLTAATVGGAGFGLVLIWAVAVGAFFKYVLNEGLARWQLATDTTLIEGWSMWLPWWAKVYFGAYLIAWTIIVSAAMANACGLGIENLTGGAVSASRGAVVHSLAGGALVWLGGFRGFERLMQLLIGVMVVAIVTCAVLTFRDVPGALGGLFVPTIPRGSTASLLALIGGVGGTITVLNYNYWMREEKIAGAAALRYVRIDLAVAYGVTAILAIAVMIMANRAFFETGVPLDRSTAVPQMAQMLGDTLGPLGSLTYSIGFWGATLSSLLGVWQGVPYMFADMYGILRSYSPEARERVTRVTSTPYRVALVVMVLIPIPFTFFDQPLLVVIAYTIIGSLFIPFLAATLLYMNNRVPWKPGVKKNGWGSNLVLGLVLVFFVIVGIRDILNAF